MTGVGRKVSPAPGDGQRRRRGWGWEEEEEGRRPRAGRERAVRTATAQAATAQAATVRAFPTAPRPRAPTLTWRDHLWRPPYTIHGQNAIPQPDLTKLLQSAMPQSHLPRTHRNTGFRAGLEASARTTSHELTFPPLIGCVIGRQGAQILEIHQMSGAQIKIENPVEGSTDRQVTIAGSAARISLGRHPLSARLSSETGGVGSSWSAAGSSATSVLLTTTQGPSVQFPNSQRFQVLNSS
ncbi:poly(rC)-binding protein 2-like [Cynocephalus volans]|uniref:poly(rC)-binding protein 2-like n=1 Tax=Cynocephalus volans TaxID=110931 RepID=UPI002FC8654F